jgi:hypothetical protein
VAVGNDAHWVVRVLMYRMCHMACDQCTAGGLSGTQPPYNRTCRTSSSFLISSAAAGRLAGSVSQQERISRASLGGGHRDSSSTSRGRRPLW